MKKCQDLEELPVLDVAPSYELQRNYKACNPDLFR